MKAKRTYRVVDSHTAGECTRLLLDRVPPLRGKNIGERKKYFSKKFDYIRTTLTQEPRFNPGVGAVLLPSDLKADYGLIFFDYRGYVDMCIHGTIGVVTSLFELGLLSQLNMPTTFETPAGLVKARANVTGDKIDSVSVSNVPSIYLGRIDIENDKVGKISAELAFGGNIYAYVDAKELGVKILPKNIQKLLELGRTVLDEVGRIKVHNPANRTGNAVLGVSFYEDLGPAEARNVMIADSDLYDRSPCGTGTCGRLAILEAQGKLSVDEKFTNQSITGSKFTGRIVKRTVVAGKRAIIPEVTGTAYLTGVSDLIVSPGDSFGEGFSVR